MRTREINLFIFFFCIIPTCIYLTSCSDNNDDKAEEYDPKNPIELTRFFPDSGGIATRFIIEGKNFGSDTANVQVFFNEKKATVLNVKGSKIYSLVPKLPGEFCNVTVVVGEQTESFSDIFHYKEQYSVTTIAGQPGTEEFVEGPLATAQFGLVNHVAVDKENNLFITQRKEVGAPICSVLNEKSGTVTYLFKGTDNLNVPTVDDDTQIVYVPLDGGDTYFEMNPANMWVPRTRQILHPSAEEQAEGKKDFKIDWKHSFAFSRFDGMIYTRAGSGNLVRFDPETRVGELVESGLGQSSDSYLVFDPLNPEILYISYTQRHCIYTYNLLTKEHKLFAGAPGQAGWNDGYLLDAEFNSPRQLTLDLEGNVFVADEKNHCIRRIDKQGIVTTAIGQPGKSGYADGTPEEALFNSPRGAVVDAEGNVYITDHENRCIRKLTLQ